MTEIHRGTVGGLTVLCVPDHRLRTVSLALGLAYGARFDPPGQGGVAHLLEHVLMAGETGREHSFCEQVERLGGHANAQTAPDTMAFYAQVAAEDVDRVAPDLCAAVLAPEIGAADFDREREVVLQELAGAAADPGDVVQDAFLAAAFAGHPLGRPVGGVPDELRALNLDDVVTAHERVFSTRPAALVAVGPLEVDRVVDLIAGAVPRRRAAEFVPTTPEPLSPVVADGPHDGFSWLCTGSRAPSRHEGDHSAYVVLACLLGSSPASVLYRKLRVERALSYSFQAWTTAYAESGVWRVLVGTDSSTVDDCRVAVRAALTEMATGGPASADLDAARRQARMDLVRTAEAPLDLAVHLLKRTWAGAVDWTVDGGIAGVTGVSAERVRLAARQVLDGLVEVVRP
ncbi:pitrilysin family protein [Saccharothrix violaceirubra]|uniref:Putative Zn-dependent peptidase n=1 Tax=Saccharothrix violaceirubra TaxID=413306 RepID=A0A7W7T384_9PSEU|nr:pitrilysin family protein [Saccharothrix violaceirubra]MBB4965755.1 putative Zn-dependent peptidase [Saccharothrix violaceirubra]